MPKIALSRFSGCPIADRLIFGPRAAAVRIVAWVSRWVMSLSPDPKVPVLATLFHCRSQDSEALCFD